MIVKDDEIYVGDGNYDDDNSNNNDTSNNSIAS